MQGGHSGFMPMSCGHVLAPCRPLAALKRHTVWRSWAGGGRLPLRLAGVAR